MFTHLRVVLKIVKRAVGWRGQPSIFIQLLRHVWGWQQPLRDSPRSVWKFCRVPFLWNPGSFRNAPCRETPGKSHLFIRNQSKKISLDRERRRKLYHRTNETLEGYFAKSPSDSLVRQFDAQRHYQLALTLTLCGKTSCRNCHFNIALQCLTALIAKPLGWYHSCT